MVNKMSRAYKNIVTNLIVQIIAAISGLILPKLIISTYGSAMNGMVGAISQFLIYAGLVEAGVGNAAVVAIYAPLASSDYKGMDEVLSVAARKYRNTGIIYTIIASLIALLYPFTIKGQVGYSFAFEMTMIIALSGVIDYFIIGKYKVLLMADQKYYIINITKSVSKIVLTIGSLWLLLGGYSLLTIKALEVALHLLEALVIAVYVKINYSQISFHENSNMKFEQQKGSMIHQICMVITYNTDLIVLTLLMPANSLLEISVYSVYSMILSFTKEFMSVLYNGIGATFGNMYASGNMETLRKRFSQYELVFYIALFIIYSCFGSLILPFVRCYVGNVTDVNYVRVELAVLFGLIGLVAQIKDAHGTLINAGCGKYNETRKYAIYEASSNLLISVILVRRLGIVGVLIGTLISHLFMDYGVIKCACSEILRGTVNKTISRIARNVVLYVVITIIETKITYNINNWIQWVEVATAICLLNILIFIGMNYLFDRKEILNLFKTTFRRGGCI
jgi:hypothetical protein